MLKIGTCGWGYIPEKGDKLINYINTGYDAVEINYSFYRIPKLSTVKKWRKKADKINEEFEFTLKVYKGITHLDRLRDKSFEYFNIMKELGKVLRSKVLLFQFPHSFKPTKENIEQFKIFFSTIDRENFKIAVELRWEKEWNKKIVRPLFRDLNLIHAVDPLRQNYFSDTIHYYRLHGFGKRMYDYQYSDQELKELLKKVNEGYVFFNNYSMYEDALRFKSLL